jgi:hypothetical protein
MIEKEMNRELDIVRKEFAELNNDYINIIEKNILSKKRSMKYCRIYNEHNERN